MRIGIVPDSRYIGGGSYQYSLTMLHAFNELKKCEFKEDKFFVFVQQLSHYNTRLLRDADWNVKSLEPFSLKRFTAETLLHLIGERNFYKIWGILWDKFRFLFSVKDVDTFRSRLDIKQWLNSFNIGLMFYFEPNPLSFEIGISYVIAVHDIQHRLHPEFPEVSANGELKLREYIFRNAIKHATLVLVDSEVGKEDILNCYGVYGIDPERIKILPFIPPPYLSRNVTNQEVECVKKTYNLPDSYLFYPAQFWPHKNHIRIIEALAIIKQKYHLELPLVLCGSHITKIQKITFRKVMKIVNRLGLKDQIYYLGYVSNEAIAILYSRATALVMPTFFGPTNIPVVEAWSFGCPVLTSDIRGIREQVGDAAVLVDPNSADSIADGIYRLWGDVNLRSVMSARGKSRLFLYSYNDYRNRLIEIIKEAKERIRF